MRLRDHYYQKTCVRTSLIGAILMLTTLFAGCAGVQLNEFDLIRAIETTKQVAKSFQDITPEQEYYIGRAVGATIAGQYAVYDNRDATQYINLLGQTLAGASERPETFGGYHFLILDSEEINAFAAPGGLIFVTRGMLRCARHEDALAAVLAHEISHVQLKHGLQAIKKSRLTSTLTTVALEETKARTGGDLATLTGLFQDTITDITTTLITNGYSRAFEREADRAAVAILTRVGYNPRGLVEMLRIMETRLNPEGHDFARTHPSPSSRIADLQEVMRDYPEIDPPKVRQTRFDRTLGAV